MENTQKIVQYRERLDNTLASHDLVYENSIRNLVRNQLIDSSSPPETHGSIEDFLENRTCEVSNFLDMLRSASRIGSEVSKTGVTPHRDWKLKQDTEDFRVMYREGPEGTPFHTLLVEGYVDGPLDVCLCLSWEAALFEKWWPQYNVPPFKITDCHRLQDVRIDEQIIQMRVKVAWPLSAREIILHYFELEYFEDDLIIVLLKSISDTDDVDQTTHGFTRDGIPAAKDFVRIDVVGGFVLQKVTSSRSYFRTIATMDVKLDFVPPSLINFLSRQLIGSGFKLYKKTVASVAKGDEDFGRALKAPLYVRVREGLHPENKLKKAVELEGLKNDISASFGLEGPPVKINAMDMEQINSSDCHETTSSQEDIPIPSQTYNCEIEEVDVEKETESDQTSNGKREVAVEQVTNLQEGEVMDHSTTNFTRDNCNKEKALISSEVEHALRVLDNAISMVRKGFSIQNWSGSGSNKQEHLHMETIATEVSSSSFGERSDNEGCQKASQVDNLEGLEEDESSSGFFDIRHDKQDSPLREVNHNQPTLVSPIQTSEPGNTTRVDSYYSFHNGKILEAPVLGNMSKDINAATVGANGDHEGGESMKKKQRRCCLYFFTAEK